MNKKQVTNSILLVLTAFIWGAAFVAQSVGMNYVGPYTYNSVRFFIGGLVLIPVIFIFRDKNKQNTYKNNNERKKDATLIGGIACGIVLAIASSLQQTGISYTTVGKAGFITTLYIIIVPIFGIFLKQKVKIIFWISVILAIIGMYFLSITENFTIEKGDFLIFLCAVFFSIHILVIDHFSPISNGIRMSCIQFFVCSALCGIPMILFEHPELSHIIDGKIPILYAGIMSCGVAYTLQIVAQKNVNPVFASLILSLESVFAALCGWILLGEALSVREITGCVFVFLAIIIAQLPEPNKIKFRQEIQSDTITDKE
jgi:drug/metabolite transporter (DMT)-like permease